MILQLLEDEARRCELGERAKKVLEQESGATQRVMERLRELLGAQVPVRARA